ncbi:MAG: hypothetical protein ACHQNT_12835 [Bacteroidia bacterium]
MKEPKNKSPFKSGLFAFILTFIFLLALLTAQFIYRYKEDLFEKHLDTWTLVKICSFSMVTLSSLILPISVLVMSVVYYRQKFGVEETDIKRTIKKAILPVMAFCFVGFLWVAFVIPKATLHQVGLLYDITMKNPDEPLQRSNLKLFSTFHTTCNLFQLGELTEERNILKKGITISKMFGFPFLILISFFIGMFIGILNRHQKYLALLLVGIYFTIFPGLHYLMIWFEKLMKEQILSPFQGQLYFLLILTAITLLLYKYATTQLRTDTAHADNR